MKIYDLVIISVPLICGLIGIGTFLWYEISTSKSKNKYTVADIPKLVNLTKNEPYDVYIGRANHWLNLPKSKWCNPYHLKGIGREVCVNKHLIKLEKDTDLLNDLHELSGKTLGCHCCKYDWNIDKGKVEDNKIKKCHGHNLIKMYMKIVLGFKEEDIIL